MKIGFDNNKYLTLQAQHIRARREQFGDKLYIEFGGKLFDDYHASRVLPGFQPDSKIRMLAPSGTTWRSWWSSAPETSRRRRSGATWASAMMRTCCGSWMFSGAWAFMSAPWSSPSTPVSRRRTLHQASDGPGRPELSPLPHCRVSLGRGPHRVRRRPGQKRLYRDLASHRGGNGPRPRQRQDGHLPEPAVP